MARKKKLVPLDPKEMSLDQEIHKLFQHLWLKSIGTKGHDREEWKELEGMLKKRGIDI